MSESTKLNIVVYRLFSTRVSFSDATKRAMEFGPNKGKQPKRKKNIHGKLSLVWREHLLHIIPIIQYFFIFEFSSPLLSLSLSLSLSPSLSLSLSLFDPSLLFHIYLLN